MALGLAGAAVVGSGWVTVRLLQSPERPPLVTSQADGFSAQQKLFEIVVRPGRTRSTVLSDRELTAFLARHLDPVADLGLRDVSVRLPAEGLAQFTGSLPLRSLTTEAPLRGLAGLLPGWWLERPVWLEVEARPRVETGSGDRRYLRLDAEAVRIGRQRVPVFVLRLLLSPTALLALRWPLPEGIASVSVEPGRLVLQGASPR